MSRPKPARIPLDVTGANGAKAAPEATPTLPTEVQVQRMGELAFEDAQLLGRQGYIQAQRQWLDEGAAAIAARRAQIADEMKGLTG